MVNDAVEMRDRISSRSKIPKKRYFLPLVLLIGLIGFKGVRDFIYLPFLVSGVSLILFWNFPSIVYLTSTKPLYYEDLFIDEKKLPNYEVDAEVKSKFQTIFIWTLIFTNTIFVGALSDYWLYKTISVESYIEIVGVTGGIIKIFQIINSILGGIMLTILRHYIRKENRRFNIEQQKNIESIVSLKRVESNRAFRHIEMVSRSPNRNNITIEIAERC